MPELAEQMYSSQQICIPPSFPYLLRQYAKAAIRTQPRDLLRWSTAYFRCLALNLPAPVKPRLEYPIPKSHYGLTPGWLRALMYQLQNAQTVSFQVLWDRWIGACLQHINLIEILCLGGFTDPTAIPWFRFVGLCASHLTENLTQTMILTCDILTEEPEGGSAMIPVEVFNDIYQFLAKINASEPQWLRNLYFTDSLLCLFRERAPVEVEEEVVEAVEEEKEEIVEVEEVKEEVVEEGPQEDLVGVVISCPDIAADDYKTEEDFLAQEQERETTEKSESLSEQSGKSSVKSKTDTVSIKEDTGSKGGDAVSVKSPTDTVSMKSEGDAISVKSKADAVSVKSTGTKGDRDEVELPTEEPEGKESVDTLIGYMPPREQDEESSEELKDEPEESGEGEEEELDEDLQKLKMDLQKAADEAETEGSEESEKKAEEEEEKGELIYVDAVLGIGPIVPPNLMEAVVTYMKECAAIQHGMVMPRNVRHFNCPPLEVMT